MFGPDTARVRVRLVGAIGVGDHLVHDHLIVVAVEHLVAVRLVQTCLENDGGQLIATEERLEIDLLDGGGDRYGGQFLTVLETPLPDGLQSGRQRYRCDLGVVERTVADIGHIAAHDNRSEVDALAEGTAIDEGDVVGDRYGRKSLASLQHRGANLRELGVRGHGERGQLGAGERTFADGRNRTGQGDRGEGASREHGIPDGRQGVR